MPITFRTRTSTPKDLDCDIQYDGRQAKPRERAGEAESSSRRRAGVDWHQGTPMEEAGQGRASDGGCGRWALRMGKDFGRRSGVTDGNNLQWQL
ncbi:hypothetical protein AAFF_G00142090 [Aldrovandia affinis]|uniref:Uncharacterized protein n=1 Tax=Aldrovandia affinis TaxID=143900 RepID=A0AAD7X326_9TELE|nr:hypothetical protein AAFF_G00142090 [Aldrovandia affinis]